MSKPVSQREARIVSVKLEPQRTHEVLNALDEASAKAAKHDRSVRVTRRIFNLDASITQHSGSRAHFVVVTRNISSRGLAFIHGHFVHAGSRFDAVLPSLDGQTIAKVSGKVVRCRHVTGMIHEVAVQFDSSIDLPLFAELTPDEEQRCWNDLELMAPGKAGQSTGMSGSMLVIDADAGGRAVTTKWLQRMGFKVTDVAGGEEAMKVLKDGKFDFVILDLAPEQDKGVPLSKAIRSAGFTGQILAAAAEMTDAACQRGTDAGCDALVAKPVTGRNLYETINRMLDAKVEPKGAEPLRSSLEFDKAMKPLILQFVQKAPGLADSLAAAVEPLDLERIKAVCGSLKGEGGAHGFWQVTRFADDVLASLAGDRAESIRRVNRLVVLLRRVTTSGSAAA